MLTGCDCSGSDSSHGCCRVDTPTNYAFIHYKYIVDHDCVELHNVLVVWSCGDDRGDDRVGGLTECHQDVDVHGP